MRCHRNGHLEAQRCRMLRKREREKERLRGGEEHDTNRLVSELRPTWRDLGLWRLLLARASILISVDIYYAPITVNTVENFRVIRSDRYTEREHTFIHVAFASSSPWVMLVDDKCVIFAWWSNVNKCQSTLILTGDEGDKPTENIW